MKEKKWEESLPMYSHLLHLPEEDSSTGCGGLFLQLAELEQLHLELPQGRTADGD